MLDLDAPLETPAGPATPRQLLAHVGGLRCEAERSLAEFPTVSAAVAGAGLRAYGPPGELWVYSNAGYWLVGAEVERVTGRSFAEALRAHVLEPRGVGGAGFDPPSTAGHEPVEPGAVEHRPTRSRPTPPRGGRAAGSSRASPTCCASRTGSGTTPSARAAAGERPGGEQALGWMLDRRDGRVLVHHPGSAAGFESTLTLVPDRRVAVAALTNSARGSAAFGPVVDALLEAVADVPPWAPTISAVSADDLRRLAGRYAGPDEEVVVEARGDGLAVRVAERDPFTGETTAYPEFLGRPVSAQDVRRPRG